MYRIYKNNVSSENFLVQVKYPSQLGDIIAAFLKYEKVILVEFYDGQTR